LAPFFNLSRTETDEVWGKGTRCSAVFVQRCPLVRGAASTSWRVIAGKRRDREGARRGGQRQEISLPALDRVMKPLAEVRIAEAEIGDRAIVVDRKGRARVPHLADF